MTPEARAQVDQWIKEKNPPPYRAEPAASDIPEWGRIATIEERHQRTKVLLGQAIAVGLSGPGSGKVAAALNLLLIGNEEGEPPQGAL